MIVSTWSIDEWGVRRLGESPRLVPGQHRLTQKQKAAQKRRTLERYRREQRTPGRRRP